MDIIQYKEISDNISSIVSVDEFVAEHTNLLDESSDYAFKYIRDFLLNTLDNDYEFSINPSLIINSSYLSDYFKKSILKLLDNNTNQEVISIVKGNTDINDMSKEEIKKIYDLYTKMSKDGSNLYNNIFAYFELYLFQLNGSGINSFIKDNVDNSKIGNYVLKLSGLPNNTMYYEKETVDYKYLNSIHLKKVFERLYLIDKEYALEFVELVCRMKIISMVEFINSFKEFIDNGFKIDKEYNIEDDIKERIDLSTGMKQTFLLEIRDKLVENNQDLIHCDYRRY